MGKINYDELQALLKNGKSQADCSRHFQVSQAAICKAVKRLKSEEVPQSLERLTHKEQAFVLNLAEGKSATESALVAYDCKNRDVAKTLGCRMQKDPDIQEALSDIMAQEGIPRRRRIQRVGDLIESKDMTAVARGLDLSFKLDGSYAPEKIDMEQQFSSFHTLVALMKGYKRRTDDDGGE
jgi:hypothetical protein